MAPETKEDQPGKVGDQNAAEDGVEAPSFCYEFDWLGASFKEDESLEIKDLNPIGLPLLISNLDSCCVIEDLAFDMPEERCTREKVLIDHFAYRLTTCGGISLGLFTTVNPNTRDSRRIDTFDTSELVETDRKNGARHCLVAHIVATKSTSDVVTDEAMDYPKDWNSESRSHSTLGHREEGRTICLHSLAVLPDFQGMKVGSTLLKGYCQRIQESGIADRIALIAHDHMVPFYESMRFRNKGSSEATFGVGGWHDMVLELEPVQPFAEYGD